MPESIMDIQQYKRQNPALIRLAKWDEKVRPGSIQELQYDSQETVHTL